MTTLDFNHKQVRWDAVRRQFVQIVKDHPMFCNQVSEAFASKNPQRFLTADQLKAATAPAPVAQAAICQPGGELFVYVRQATLDYIAASGIGHHEITVRTEQKNGWVALCPAPVPASQAAQQVAVDDARTPAARDVLAERKRQVEIEGWTPANDDEHAQGQMADAASCYATGHPAIWPWPAEWWKPAGERRNLVKAGALILAEIERIDRAAMSRTAKEPK